MKNRNIIKEMKIYQQTGYSNILNEYIIQKVNEFAKTYPGTRGDGYPWEIYIEDMKRNAISLIYDQIRLMTDEKDTFPEYPKGWIFGKTGISFAEFIKKFQLKTA